MELGDPDVGTDYELCVYDGASNVHPKAAAPAGGTCAGNPTTLEKNSFQQYKGQGQ